MGGTRRRTAAVLTAGAAAALTMATPAQAAPGTPCHPRGYVLEKQTRTATVVRKRYSYRVYGCLKSRGKLVRLPGAVESYALAGRYVAYTDVYSEPTETTHTLIVRDLLKNSVRRAAPPYDGEYTSSEIVDIVLKRNGSVAWISCNVFEQRCFAGADTPYQVWRADRRGVRLLQESPEIGLRSLTLNGRRIAWRVKGKRRTATLR